MNGDERGAPRIGVLTWECAGSVAGRNTFLFCSPGWDRAAFSVFVSAGGPGGLARQPGEPMDGALPRRWPPPVGGPGVEAPPMTGRASPYYPTVGPGSLSYQGVCFPSDGLKPTLMTGQCGISGALPRDQRRVGGGAFTNDGTCNTGAKLSAG